jgi:hypothetical protein
MIAGGAGRLAGARSGHRESRALQQAAVGHLRKGIRIRASLPPGHGHGGGGGPAETPRAPLPAAWQQRPLWRPAPRPPQQQHQHQQQQRGVAAASGGGRLPNQADSLFNPSDRDDVSIGLAERVATRSVSDLDYLTVRRHSTVTWRSCWGRGAAAGGVARLGTGARAREQPPLSCSSPRPPLSTRRTRRHPNPKPPLPPKTAQELLAIQQDDGPKNLGFFGTRNMGMTHQKLVEILSYAMVSTVGGLWGGVRRGSCARCCDQWVIAGASWVGP